MFIDLLVLSGTFRYFLILTQRNAKKEEEKRKQSLAPVHLGAMQCVNIWEPNWLDRCLNTHGHVYRLRWIMWRWTWERAWGGTKDMVAKHVCQFQQKQNLTQILCFIHNINGNATRCVWFGMCKNLTRYLAKEWGTCIVPKSTTQYTTFMFWKLGENKKQ